MKTLYIDIETTPLLVDRWGMFDRNPVALNQLRESTRVFCFGAQWADARRVTFYAEWKTSHLEMIEQAHELFSAADVVVHYNGATFDVKHLNREFYLAGMRPPAPFQQVDLLKAVRKNFAFPSNRLAHIAEQSGIGSKVKHEGHELWVKCMAGDAAARRRMERYCKQDVALLKPLHDKLRPWIAGHPNHALYSGEPGVCPNCGSDSYHREGYAYTSSGKYARFQCNDCGRWFQATRREEGTDVRGVA